jgi:hypothetical protein
LRLLLLVGGNNQEKKDSEGCPDGHLFSQGDG